uniref:Odorant receptor n=1 Tax=Trichogramma kaykai TaxID=54128 RepID=A0ABD2WNV5_9HYME
MLIKNSLEHQVLPVPFHLLTIWGVWCPENFNPSIKKVYSVFTIIVLAVQMSLTLGVSILFVMMISSKNFDLDIFFMMTSLINGMYKALNIFYYRKRILSLLTRGFEDRWHVPRDDYEKYILEIYFNESWRIHLIYAVACLAGVFIKLIGPMVKYDTDLKLPTSSWYPYNTNETVYFWVSYSQQMFVGGSIISMHIGADTLLSGMILQSCVQLQLLKHRLRSFSKHCIDAHRYLGTKLSKSSIESVFLRQYICDHQLIYTYLKMINHDFSGWLLAMLAVVVPNICINVYLLSFQKIGMNVDFVTTFGLLSISLFQIYLPCWYGNGVILHSTEITNAIFEMDWTDLSPFTRKALIIMMMRSLKPSKIETAHIIPINIKALLKIMKTSYSFLSVLQQM